MTQTALGYARSSRCSKYFPGARDIHSGCGLLKRLVVVDFVAE